MTHITDRLKYHIFELKRLLSKKYFNLNQIRSNFSIGTNVSRIQNTNLKAIKSFI